MKKIMPMNEEPFLDLVDNIFALQDTKTVQGNANLMAACKLVHNQLLLAAGQRDWREIGGWGQAFKGRPEQVRIMDYPAVPKSIEMPEVWTDGPILQFDDELPRMSQRMSQLKRRGARRTA